MSQPGANNRDTHTSALPTLRRRAQRSPSAVDSLRAALLELDARDLRQVQGHIRELLAPESSNLRRYRRAYERSLPRTGHPVPRRRVVDAARRSELVLVGDYHTLPEAQRAVLVLALDLAREGPLVLGLEMVRREHQAALDGYLDGRLGDLEFQSAIQYGATWPFPWRHYRPLLDAARSGGWPVLALDAIGGPARRDRTAAAVLTESLAERPDAVHLAVVGDLHLAPEHLPARVLAARPGTRMTVLHQNEPQIYHDLVARGLDLSATTVALGPGRFCLLNATPLRRERSYLAWIENRWGDGQGTIADPVGEFAAARARLAELLEIDVPAADWVVLTGESLPFLGQLEQLPVSPARLARVRQEIIQRGRTLVSELGSLYIRVPTLDDLAELAMRALQEEQGEPVLVDAAVAGEEGETLLLAAVRREALGFMASCLLHPFRLAAEEPRDASMPDPAANRAGREAVGRLGRELYYALEGRILSRRPFRLTPRLRAMNREQQWHVAGRVGRLLGGQLFFRLVDGSIGRREIHPLLAPPVRRRPRQRERQAILELAALAFRRD